MKKFKHNPRYKIELQSKVKFDNIKTIFFDNKEQFSHWKKNSFGVEKQNYKVNAFVERKPFQWTKLKLERNKKAKK